MYDMILLIRNDRKIQITAFGSVKLSVKAAGLLLFVDQPGEKGNILFLFCCIINANT